MTEALTPAAARALVGEGVAVLVDVDQAPDFAKAHPAGALNVPFSRNGLGERVRVAAPAGAGVIVVAVDDVTAEEAEAQIASSRLPVRGHVAGGVAAWRAAGLPLSSVREVDLQEIGELPQLAGDVTVVDVREPMEWATGHVPGALLIPLGKLRAALDRVPRRYPVIVICESGLRSATGASILKAEGYTDVAHVPVGTGGYRRARLPLEFPKAGHG